MLGAVRHSLAITGFVSVMMLVVEYLNVLTRGRWESRLAGSKWGQYLLGAALGATPGCLGAFAVVTMYSHRTVTIGAVVAAMVATSGDEAFVMLATIPKQALLLAGILFVLGIVAGALTDAFLGKRAAHREVGHEKLEVHEEDHCVCFPRGQLLRQWKHCTTVRGILGVGLAAFMVGLATGQIGPPTWNWTRMTLLVACAAALFIVGTVPDHFLDEHLWQHVARKHVPRIFLWTLGALVVMQLLTECLHIEETILSGKWLLLVIACLVGLIPESGPHFIFVVFYAKGVVPFSALLASSIVQDGHGMLPMLAHSRRTFLEVKGVNLVVGLLAGGAAMVAGW